MSNDHSKNLSEQLARWREMRHQLFSILNHDLRAPLTAIVGFAELIDDENLTPQQRGYVQRILEACDKIVNTLEQARRLLSEVEIEGSSS